MYPLIYLDHNTGPINIECNQHDTGSIRYFVFDDDLSGKAVKYIVSLKDGHNVTDWCQIESDHRTVAVVIPPQVTEVAGTYQAQLIVLDQSAIDSSFELWKSQVLAGETSVVVENPTSTTSSQNDSPQTATLSFEFNILVYKSVYQNGDYFEGDFNKWIQKIEQSFINHDQRMDRLEELLQDTEAGALALWKEQVLAGQTPVLVDKEEGES